MPFWLLRLSTAAKKLGLTLLHPVWGQGPNSQLSSRDKESYDTTVDPEQVVRYLTICGATAFRRKGQLVGIWGTAGIQTSFSLFLFFLVVHSVAT